MTLKLDGWPWKTIGHVFYTTSSFVHHFKSIGEVKLELNSGQNWWFFVLPDLEIWQMTLKNNRAPLLYYIKLCTSFQSHRWIQTGVTVPKRSIQVKISNFLSHVTLKFDGWLWKSIGHLSYVASSFVHHFIAIGEFKLELQSGNAQFGSKSMIFFSCVTLKFDRWPWETIGHRSYVASSFVHHFVAIGDFWSCVALEFDAWPWKTIGHLF